MACVLPGITAILLMLSGAAPRATPPCKPTSAEARSARASLEALGRQIQSLGEQDDVAPALEKFSRLRTHRCFAGTVESYRFIDDADTVGLKVWWRDGGERWLKSLLDLGADVRKVVIPPDVRHTLPSAEPSALSEVHCTSADPACAEAARWQERVQAELDAVQQTELAKWPPFSPERCTALIEDEPRATRYREWRKCLEQSRPKMASLPLVRLRIPQRGWLVIRGRRGHYEFCDELRAYSLSTGAAYIAQSCSGLALQQGGTVDFAKTDTSREWRIRSGQLRTEDVRELALLLLVRPHIEEQVQREALEVDLPPELTPRWSSDDSQWDVGGYGQDVWGHTGQTRLSWRYVLDEGRNANGSLTWPDSSEVAGAVAARWLAKLEARFVDGCPPEPLSPQVLGFSGSPNVGTRDAPNTVRSVGAELEKRVLAVRRDCAAADAGR